MLRRISVAPFDGRLKECGNVLKKGELRPQLGSAGQQRVSSGSAGRVNGRAFTPSTYVPRQRQLYFGETDGGPQSLVPIVPRHEQLSSSCPMSTGTRNFLSLSRVIVGESAGRGRRSPPPIVRQHEQLSFRPGPVRACLGGRGTQSPFTLHTPQPTYNLRGAGSLLHGDSLHARAASASAV